MLPESPPDERGLSGIAFRSMRSTASRRGLYIRPTNARTEDQCAATFGGSIYLHDFDFDRLAANHRQV